MSSKRFIINKKNTYNFLITFILKITFILIFYLTIKISILVFMLNNKKIDHFAENYYKINYIDYKKYVIIPYITSTNINLFNICIKKNKILLYIKKINFSFTLLKKIFYLPYVDIKISKILLLYKNNINKNINFLQLLQLKKIVNLFLKQNIFHLFFCKKILISIDYKKYFMIKNIILLNHKNNKILGFFIKKNHYYIRNTIKNNKIYTYLYINDMRYIILKYFNNTFSIYYNKNINHNLYFNRINILQFSPKIIYIKFYNNFSNILCIKKNSIFVHFKNSFFIFEGRINSIKNNILGEIIFNIHNIKNFFYYGDERYYKKNNSILWIKKHIIYGDIIGKIRFKYNLKNNKKIFIQSKGYIKNASITLSQKYNNIFLLNAQYYLNNNIFSINHAVGNINNIKYYNSCFYINNIYNPTFLLKICLFDSLEKISKYFHINYKKSYFHIIGNFKAFLSLCICKNTIKKKLSFAFLNNSFYIKKKCYIKNLCGYLKRDNFICGKIQGFLLRKKFLFHISGKKNIVIKNQNNIILSKYLIINDVISNILLHKNNIKYNILIKCIIKNNPFFSFQNSFKRKILYILFSNSINNVIIKNNTKKNFIKFFINKNNSIFIKSNIQKIYNIDCQRIIYYFKKININTSYKRKKYLNKIYKKYFFNIFMKNISIKIFNNNIKIKYLLLNGINFNKTFKIYNSSIENNNHKILFIGKINNINNINKTDYHIHGIIKSNNFGKLLNIIKIKKLHYGNGNIIFKIKKNNNIILGKIYFNIKNGKIIKLGKNINEKIRISNIINFFSIRSILKRLNMDFNDFLEYGFIFDNLHGMINIKNYKIFLNNISIIGPVGKIIINGKTNILNKRYCFLLCVNPIVTSSIPVLIGTLYHPIYGIFFWIFNQILNDEMQNIISNQYCIKGKF